MHSRTSAPASTKRDGIEQRDVLHDLGRLVGNWNG